jgi:hypothetical protein
MEWRNVERQGSQCVPPCSRMPFGRAETVSDKLSDIKQGRPARINRAALFCRYQRGTEAEKEDYTVTGYNYL